MALAAAQLAQQQRGLDRCHRGLLSLVLARTLDATAVERLRFVVAGQHAEPYRDSGVQSDTGQAVGDGAADVVEVRRASSDDDAESDNGVVALLREHLRRDR